MNKTNPKVDFYFSKAKKWQEELKKLRTIVLDCRGEENSKGKFKGEAARFTGIRCRFRLRKASKFRRLLFYAADLADASSLANPILLPSARTSVRSPTGNCAGC